MPGFFKSISNLFKRGRTKRAAYSALYDDPGERQASGSARPPESQHTARSTKNGAQLHGSNRKGGHYILGSLKRRKGARDLQAVDRMKNAVMDEPEPGWTVIGLGTQTEEDRVASSSSRLVVGEVKDDVEISPRASAGKPERPPKSSARPHKVSRRKVTLYPAPNITIVKEEYTTYDDPKDSRHNQHREPSSAAADSTSLKPRPRRLKKEPRVRENPMPEFIPRSVIQAVSPMNVPLLPLEELEEDMGVLPNGVEIPSFPNVKVGDGKWDLDLESHTEALMSKVKPLEDSFEDSFEDQASLTEPTEAGNTEGDTTADTTAITDLFPTPLSTSASLTDGECHSLPPREVYIYEESKCDNSGASSFKGLFDGEDSHLGQMPKEEEWISGEVPRQDTMYSTEESVVVPVTTMRLQSDSAHVQFIPPLSRTAGTRASKHPIDEPRNTGYQGHNVHVSKASGPPPLARATHNVPLPDLGMADSDDMRIPQCITCGFREKVHRCTYSDEEEEEEAFPDGDQPVVVTTPIAVPGGSQTTIKLSDLGVASELPPVPPHIGRAPIFISIPSELGIDSDNTAGFHDSYAQVSPEPWGAGSQHDAFPVLETDMPGKPGWIYHHLSSGLRVPLPSSIPLEERPAWAEGKLRIQSAAARILAGDITMENWDGLLEALDRPPFDWLQDPPNEEASELESDLLLQYEGTLIAHLMSLLCKSQDRMHAGATLQAFSFWPYFDEDFERLGWREEAPSRFRHLVYAVELEIFPPAGENGDPHEALDVDPTARPRSDPWESAAFHDDDSRIAYLMSGIRFPQVPPGDLDMRRDVVRAVLKCARRLMAEPCTTEMWDDLLETFAMLRWLDFPPDHELRALNRTGVEEFEENLTLILKASDSQFGLVLDLITSVHQSARRGVLQPGLWEMVEQLGWDVSTPELFRDLLAQHRITGPIEIRPPGMDSDYILIPGCSMTFTVAAQTGDRFGPTAIEVTANSTLEQFQVTFGGQLGADVWENLTMDLILKYLAQIMKRDYPYSEYLRTTPASRLLDLAAQGLITMEDLERGWLKDSEREHRFADVAAEVDMEDGGEGKGSLDEDACSALPEPSSTVTMHRMTRMQNAKKRKRDAPRHWRLPK